VWTIPLIIYTPKGKFRNAPDFKKFKKKSKAVGKIQGGSRGGKIGRKKTISRLSSGRKRNLTIEGHAGRGATSKRIEKKGENKVDDRGGGGVLQKRARCAADCCH